MIDALATLICELISATVFLFAFGVIVGYHVLKGGAHAQ